MVKISFVGDVTCDRPFLQAAKKDGKYDFSGAFKEIGSVLKASDYSVGNLETTFCGKGVEYNEGFRYNTPDEFIDELRNSGIDLLTTANNHCFDGGVAGLLRTLNVVSDNGFDVTGTFCNANSRRYLIKEFGSVKVAFLSYTYSINVYSDVEIPRDVSPYINLLRPVNINVNMLRSMYRLYMGELKRKIKKLFAKPTITAYVDKLYPEYIDESSLKSIINEINGAKKEADIVVFCLHIGGQFNEKPGDYSEYMMKFLKEQGVDVVIGHHPHTIQKTEATEKGNIYAYSLGGFSLSPSAIYINHECKPEYSQILNLYIDENTKKIQKCTFSLVKIIEDDNAFISVIPVNKLYHSLNNTNKTALFDDVKSLYKRITGKTHEFEQICDEYILF